MPVSVVWEKILTAPDSSSLSVMRDGQKIGYGHWITSVGEEWANVSEESIPSGQPGKARGFQLRFEGNALIAEMTNRLRFEFTLKLAGNREWQELDARVAARPSAWELHASAAQETLRLTVREGEASFERVFKFSDLQNPRAPAREFVGPFGALLLNELPLAAQLPGAGNYSVGVKWTAVEDALRIGRTPVRAYRLQTRLLDRYEIKIFVSRAGEILRVDLPGNVALVNDQLTFL